MRKPIPLPLVLFVAVGAFILYTSAKAHETQSGMTALRSLHEFGREQGSLEKNRVVGLVGFYGKEQPRQWMVLVSDARTPINYREYVVRNGKSINSRSFQRPAEQDFPSIPLSMGHVRVDSDRAFGICNAAALRAGVAFDSLHYQLRCRDLRNEPVWVVNLLDHNHANVGVIYLSAMDGSILRTMWNRDISPGQYTKATPEQKGLLPRLFANRAAKEVANHKQPQRPVSNYPQTTHGKPVIEDTRFSSSR